MPARSYLPFVLSHIQCLNPCKFQIMRSKVFHFFVRIQITAHSSHFISFPSYVCLFLNFSVFEKFPIFPTLISSVLPLFFHSIVQSARVHSIVGLENLHHTLIVSDVKFRVVLFFQNIFQTMTLRISTIFFGKKEKGKTLDLSDYVIYAVDKSLQFPNRSINRYILHYIQGVTIKTKRNETKWS